MSIVHILRVGAIYFFITAIIHALLPWYFQWKKTYKDLGKQQTAYQYLMNIKVIFFCIIFGIIAFIFPIDLVKTSLGKFLLAAAASLWILMILIQALVFGIKKMISILLFFHFIIGFLLFILPFLYITNIM